MAQDRVRFRVGEQVFFTSRGTIENGGRNSLLGAMTDSLWQKPAAAVGDSFSEANELFIDRNPAYFSVLLDMLRTGALHIPAGMSETALFDEALYYGIMDEVRAAKKCGPLNGNNMDRTASVRGCGAQPVEMIATPEAVIRANADGGCCVARGALVRVYDWMLQHQAILNLDYVKVTDMASMGAKRVLIGAEDTDVEFGQEFLFMGGGVACFDLNSGELVHRYNLMTPDGHQLTSFMAAAVAADDGGHVFAYCRHMEHAQQPEERVIGAWDQTTGKQVHLLSGSEAGLPPIRIPLEDKCKLQWLPERNLLLVASRSEDFCVSYLSLFDVRAKKIVWPSYSSPLTCQGDLVMDAVAIDNSSALWVTDALDCLGFVDLRSRNQSRNQIQWGENYVRGSSPDQHRPRLAYWGTQLFASRHDEVHVLSSVDWESGWQSGSCVRTAIVKKADGGEIADISIGGDRLFVLHKEADIFEVWETPRKRGTCIM